MAERERRRTRAVRGLTGMRGTGEGGVVRDERTEEVRAIVEGLLLLKAFFSFLVIDGLLPRPDDDDPSVPSRPASSPARQQTHHSADEPLSSVMNEEARGAEL
jgi:hypothetical protein